MQHPKPDPARLALAAACLAAIAVTALAEPRSDPNSPQFLSHVVAKLAALHRVTAEPHLMEDSTVTACVPTYNPNIHEGVLHPAYCHVYVTADAKAPIESGKGRYGEGAVIVKAKLESAEAEGAILYTVMRKMAAGYDPEHGDWEYAVLDGTNNRVLSRGRIDSCIECHRHYADTDFVTRAYLRQE